jgi:hypothetical protein
MVEAVLIAYNPEENVWLVAVRGTGFWLLKFWSETVFTNERKPEADSIEPGDIIKIPEWDMIDTRSVESLSSFF